MELGLTTAVYIAAAVLFILSLGGLSGQAAQNVPFGMVFLVWLSPFLPRWLGQVMAYGGFRLD